MLANVQQRARHSVNYPERVDLTSLTYIKVIIRHSQTVLFFQHKAMVNEMFVQLEIDPFAGCPLC